MFSQIAYFAFGEPDSAIVNLLIDLLESDFLIIWTALLYCVLILNLSSTLHLPHLSYNVIVNRCKCLCTFVR